MDAYSSATPYEVFEGVPPEEDEGENSAFTTDGLDQEEDDVFQKAWDDACSKYGEKRMEGYVGIATVIGLLLGIAVVCLDFTDGIELFEAVWMPCKVMTSARSSHNYGGYISGGVINHENHEIVENENADTLVQMHRMEVECPKTAPLLQDGTTFQDLMMRKEPVFVNYYVNWCRWSQELHPVWDELWEASSNEAASQVTLVQINCEEHRKLCDSEQIFAFPSLRFYTKEGMTQLPGYQGDRTTGRINQFLERRLQGLVDDGRKDEEQSTALPPQTLFPKPSEKSDDGLEGLILREEQHGFDSHGPHISDLDQLIKKHKYVLVLFLTASDAESLKSTWQNLSKETKYIYDNNVLFLQVQCNKYPELCLSHGVNNAVPVRATLYKETMPISFLGRSGITLSSFLEENISSDLAFAKARYAQNRMSQVQEAKEYHSESSTTGTLPAKNTNDHSEQHLNRASYWSGDKSPMEVISLEIPFDDDDDDDIGDSDDFALSDDIVIRLGVPLPRWDMDVTYAVQGRNLEALVASGDNVIVCYTSSKDGNDFAREFRRTWNEFAHQVQQSSSIKKLTVAEVDCAATPCPGHLDTSMGPYYAWYHQGHVVGRYVSVDRSVTTDSLISIAAMMTAMDEEHSIRGVDFSD